jgi:hypothetical protein
MKSYRDINGDSGVAAYEYGEDWIEVRFSAGSTRNYRYESAKIGQPHIETMKRLADAGDGLNAYINTHRDVAKGYSKRW